MGALINSISLVWGRGCDKARRLGVGLGLSLCSVSMVQAAGLLTPADQLAEPMDLTQHHVDVVIEAGYAITTVEQIFSNPSAQTLEAVYAFPVPEGAAVGEFTYWIDGKPITGEVLEKEQARQVYREEKSQGRDSALTEQDAYRRFETRVYPVPANDEVRIRLVYLQSVSADLGVGRYVYPLEEGGVDEEAMSFWTMNDKVSTSFRFSLTMRSAYPIDDFRLPRHPHAQIEQLSPLLWTVKLGDSTVRSSADDVEEAGSIDGALPQVSAGHQLNEDIVVYWRHQQGLPGSVDMLTYRPEGERRGTFMITVTPGDDLPLASQGRDWVFVLDMSGSMRGKYQSLIDGVQQALQRLNETDRFRVFVFNNTVREVTPGYVAVSKQSISKYSHSLQSINPDGGTNLYAGIAAALQGLDVDRPSALVLVSDGVANVGVVEKVKFLDLLKTKDVRLFSFIMGNSANRPLLQGMSRVSNGFSMSVSNGDDIVGRIIQAASKLTHMAYRDLSVNVSGVKVADITSSHLSTLYRGQQMVVLGHYWGEGEAKVEINGRVGSELKRYEAELSFPEKDLMHPELERLWAFASIDALQERIDYLGEDTDTRQAIVDIAVEYGLVTDYTSMIVMAEEQFAKYGIERNNAKRVEIEQSARAARAQAAPSAGASPQRGANNFSQPRAGASGGGAVHPMLLLVGLILLGLHKKAQRSRRR